MANYWAERQAETQAALTKKSIAQTEAQLTKYYAQTQKKIIGQFEQTYNKILLSIEDGRKPTPADLYKLNSYWEMQGQLKTELDKLGYKQAAILNRNFTAQYQQIYEVLAAKDDLHFSTIDTKTAEQMIKQIWCADGKSWSDRVWKNTELLQQELNDGLIDCLVSGRKPSELKALLMEKFTVSYNRADSLVRTEMAHIQTQAARQRYMDSGVQMVEVWADYDERRCEVCAGLHEKRYPVGGNMPIPAHPRCRCCIIPVVE